MSTLYQYNYNHASYSQDLLLVSGNRICNALKTKPFQNLTKIHLVLSLQVYKCGGILSTENASGVKKQAIYLFQCSSMLSLEKSLSSCLVFV